MKFTFSEMGWRDYVYWQTQDRKTLKRINRILEDIDRNGFDGIGNPEPLGYGLTGFWSRRIDSENRIVYRINDDMTEVEIIQCKGHYTDH